MPDRRRALQDWLAATAWGHWVRTPLAGDASARRYDRLRDPATGATAILMDAPPETEGTARFLGLAKHLRAHGLSAPDVLAVDRDRGFVVLEDLGPCHMAAWLKAHPDQEEALYLAATDVLLHLNRTPPHADLAPLDPETGAGMLAPLWEWFDPSLEPGPLTAAMTGALAQHTAGRATLALRDYHAENLIWRPDHTALDRCGLLDFQDAILAHPAYDLASLLRDARRDVAPGTVDAALARMIDGLPADPGPFRAAFAVLSVQRNLRILGIFTRLARRDGKRAYLALIPRVRAHIARDLAHPACADLARALGPRFETGGAT